MDSTTARHPLPEEIEAHRGEVPLPRAPSLPAGPTAEQVMARLGRRMTLADAERLGKLPYREHLGRATVRLLDGGPQHDDLARYAVSLAVGYRSAGRSLDEWQRAVCRPGRWMCRTLAARPQRWWEARWAATSTMDAPGTAMGGAAGPDPVEHVEHWAMHAAAVLVHGGGHPRSRRTDLALATALSERARLQPMDAVVVSLRSLAEAAQVSVMATSRSLGRLVALGLVEVVRSQATSTPDGYRLITESRSSGANDDMVSAPSGGLEHVIVSDKDAGQSAAPVVGAVFGARSARILELLGDGPMTAEGLRLRLGVASPPYPSLRRLRVQGLVVSERGVWRLGDDDPEKVARQLLEAEQRTIRSVRRRQVHDEERWVAHTWGGTRTAPDIDPGRASDLGLRVVGEERPPAPVALPPRVPHPGRARASWGRLRVALVAETAAMDERERRHVMLLASSRWARGWSAREVMVGVRDPGYTVPMVSRTARRRLQAALAELGPQPASRTGDEPEVIAYWERASRIIAVHCRQGSTARTGAWR